MSHRKIVMIPGMLQGMGKEVECTVGATRVSLAGSSESALSRFGIHQAPADLPDGQYTLAIMDSGRRVTHNLEKRGLGWVSRT